MINDSKVSTALGVDQKQETRFSFPQNLAPGDPTANMMVVHNPTGKALKGKLRAEMPADVPLCNRLRAAMMMSTSSAQPQLMAWGDLNDMTSAGDGWMDIDARENYYLVVMVSAPTDLENEYQGKTCPVSFVMEAREQ
jgi:hypothetical protein